MDESKARPPELDSPIHVEETKDDDTLINVHVGNPLHKIFKLLEQIKKQKAFSFTLKGTLGLAGVALFITAFGIFGGTKAFCGRGIQSHMGVLHVLTYPKSVQQAVPVIDQIREMLFGQESHIGNRIVIIEDNGNITQVKYILLEEGKALEGYQVIVTGEYDACAQSMTINDPAAVEVYPN
jgi:hypothetical protein